MTEPKPNNRANTIKGLEFCGWAWDQTARTSKFRVYVREGGKEKMLVGKSGALRLCREGKTVAESVSLTGGRIHRAYQAVGACGGWTSVGQATMQFMTELGRRPTTPISPVQL